MCSTLFLFLMLEEMCQYSLILVRRDNRAQLERLLIGSRVNNSLFEDSIMQ